MEKFEKEFLETPLLLGIPPEILVVIPSGIPTRISPEILVMVFQILLNGISVVILEDSQHKCQEESQ